MAAYPWVTHHGYGYTLGPKMVTAIVTHTCTTDRYGLLTGTGPGTAKNSWGLPVQITNHRGVKDQVQVLELHSLHLVIPRPFQPCTCLCMRHLMTIEDLDH